MATKFARILLFGDSLTQYSFAPQDGGWGAVIADYFQRRADVVNRGFSGYNTEWAKFILPKLLLSKDQADVVVVQTILAFQDLIPSSTFLYQASTPTLLKCVPISTQSASAAHH